MKKPTKVAIKKVLPQKDAAVEAVISGATVNTKALQSTTFAKMDSNKGQVKAQISQTEQTAQTPVQQYPWDACDKTEQPSIQQALTINKFEHAVLLYLKQEHNMSARSVVSKVAQQAIQALVPTIKKAESLGMSPLIDLAAIYAALNETGKIPQGASSSDSQSQYPWQEFDKAQKPSVQQALTINTFEHEVLLHLKQQYDMSARSVISKIAKQAIQALLPTIKRAESMGMSPHINLQAIFTLYNEKESH
jgi:hypothetical protein